MWAHTICDWICEKGSYSLSNCMYLTIHNLTCCVWCLPGIWYPYTPNIALFLDVTLRQWVKHMMSYDSSNLEIWKGYIRLLFADPVSNFHDNYYAVVLWSYPLYWLYNIRYCILLICCVMTCGFFPHALPSCFHRPGQLQCLHSLHK